MSRQKILMASERREPFETAVAPMVADGRIEISWVADGESAIAAIKRQRPDLLIVDARIGGREGFSLCRDVLRIDAFANMAAVSDLDEDDFHEASEGLGLIGRLPSRPTPEDFEKLMALLSTVDSPFPAPQA